MSTIKASGLGPLTASNTATIVDPATPVNGIARMSPLVSFSPVTVSGTSVDFTNIPSWARRITVMLNGVSTSGTSLIQLQLGTSGGVQTTGYTGVGWMANTLNAASSNGLLIHGTMTAAYLVDGVGVLTCVNSSTGTWAFSIVSSGGLSGTGSIGSGAKTLSGTLDRIRFTTVNGTDTFDAGTVNVFYE